MPSPPVLHTQLDGLTLVRRGKVRDVYAVDDALVLVATDRISAFDYVLGSGIPDKGRILTQLSAFWFERTRHIVPNHLLSTDAATYPVAARAHLVLQRAREPPKQDSSAFAVNQRVGRGVSKSGGDCSFERAGEFQSKTHRPCLVPGLRFEDLKPRFGTKQNSHYQLRWNNSART